jgi:hypothetical protein
LIQTIDFQCIVNPKTNVMAQFAHHPLAIPFFCSSSKKNTFSQKVKALSFRSTKTKYFGSGQGCFLRMLGQTLKILKYPSRRYFGIWLSVLGQLMYRLSNWK